MASSPLNRRRLLRSAGTAAGIGAAFYIKPSMQSFGVPRAQALSYPPGGPPSETNPGRIEHSRDIRWKHDRWWWWSWW
jgi:hypothetical protein